MKLPSDETPSNHLNGDDYLSDEYEELIPAPITNGDFSEYMWMENEEEFDSEVLRQLEEEELMEECIVAMLNDEEASFEESSAPAFESNNNSSTANNSRSSSDYVNSSVNGLSDSVNNLSLSSNGVRNNGTSDHADNTHATTQPSTVRYTAQDRLNRFRAPPVSLPAASNEIERKSNLNPDAKEFVPSPRTTTTAVTNPAEAEKSPS